MRTFKEIHDEIDKGRTFAMDHHSKRSDLLRLIHKHKSEVQSYLEQHRKLPPDEQLQAFYKLEDELKEMGEVSYDWRDEERNILEALEVWTESGGVCKVKLAESQGLILDLGSGLCLKVTGSGGSYDGDDSVTYELVDEEGEQEDDEY